MNEIKKPYFNIIETNFFGTSWIHAAVSEQLIIALPITKDGRYVAITQARPPFNNRRVISAVMGTFHETDPNKLLNTVVKEIKSETGHICIDLQYMMTVARSSGLTDETAHVYTATVEDEYKGQELHQNEDIQVLYLNRAQIQEVIVTHQYVIDASFPYYLLMKDR